MSAKQVAAKLLKQLTPVDHRVIGLKQNLFFFHDYSKGSCFFKPRGARIYNKLVDYLKLELKKRKYEEIITPNVYDCRLWEQSGHWKHYQENMIHFPIGEHEFSLKPMNCPGHCLMYQQLGQLKASQLPLRWADFGVLHRNELSGSLMGLTRVRRFQQDDAHLFCTPEQIEQEIKHAIDFMRDVYDNFNFTFSMCLSTRPPDSYMGELSQWNDAEQALKRVLEQTGLEWSVNEGDGAFYGPKIDITLRDCTGRPHQCATIQLDFQLPIRFDLKYQKEDKTQGRPIIIHRAILGSIERFIAILCESFAGNWPFWLSPIQGLIIPIHEQFDNYALTLRDRFTEAGFYVDCELNSSSTLNRKIREAEMLKYNFIMVVGKKELESDLVTLRIDDQSDNTKKKTKQIVARVDRVLELFKELDEKRVKDANGEFLAAFS